MCSSLRSEFGTTKVCHKPSAKNEICRKNEHCAEGPVCRPDEGKLLCLSKGKVGATCSSYEDRKKHMTDMQYTCLEKAKNGEPCEGSWSCGKGLECRAIGREHNAPKKCLAKFKKGEFCVNHEDCEIAYRCRGHPSLPKRICTDRGAAIGDYCSNDDDSYYGEDECNRSGPYVCRRFEPGVFTTCQKRAKHGDFCEEYWHCEGEMTCIKGPLGNGKCRNANESGDR